MKYFNIVRGEFKERPNRFIAYVELEDGRTVKCHVKNTGRCKELLLPGAVVFLQSFEGQAHNRKTDFDLITVLKNDMPVNIDSQAPNKIVEEALRKGKIKNITGSENHNIDSTYCISREQKYGDSRLDFLLTGKGETIYMEVKGVTLEEEGEAKFPDAPTERGTKHIKELIGIVEEGKRAIVFFVIQLGKAKYFTTNKEKDPKFSRTLKEAKEKGVEIMAYDCKVEKDEIILNKPVEVRV